MAPELKRDLHSAVKITDLVQNSIQVHKNIHQEQVSATGKYLFGRDIIFPVLEPFETLTRFSGLNCEITALGMGPQVEANKSEIQFIVDTLIRQAISNAEPGQVIRMFIDKISEFPDSNKKMMSIIQFYIIEPGAALT